MARTDTDCATLTARRQDRWLPLAGLVVAAFAIALAFPATTVRALGFALGNLLLMAPVIAIGVTLTAAVTASGSAGLVAASFAGRQGRMILLASAVGAVTPVCGISVLPMVAGLLAAGVPLAPIMAFWLSSPVTSPEMFAVTVGMLGTTFAVAKTAAAFAIGVASGLATLALERGGRLAAPMRAGGWWKRLAPGCGAGPECEDVEWRFWRDPARRRVFRSTALGTARLMATWLGLAFIAEYFITLHVPDAWITALLGQDNEWAIPLAATVGAPLYLDGSAALPLVRGLIDTGMSPAAGMALLVAGGITSAWTAIPVYALVRLPVFLYYVALAVVGSMLAGYGFAFVLH